VADLLDEACSPELWEPVRSSWERGAA
jgi:hypothetical protein